MVQQQSQQPAPIDPNVLQNLVELHDDIDRQIGQVVANGSMGVSVSGTLKARLERIIAEARAPKIN